MSEASISVVAAILRNRAGRILVNQRPPHAEFMPGFWEFPGGKLEPDETAWQALCRELAEELAVTVERAEPMMTLSHAYPNRTVRLEVWRVIAYSGEPVGAEGQVLAWRTPQALRGLDLLPADEPVVTALIASAQGE